MILMNFSNNYFLTVSLRKVQDSEGLAVAESHGARNLEALWSRRLPHDVLALPDKAIGLVFFSMLEWVLAPLMLPIWTL